MTNYVTSKILPILIAFAVSSFGPLLINNDKVFIEVYNDPEELQDSVCDSINGDSIYISIINLSTNKDKEIEDKYLSFDISIDSLKIYCYCFEDIRKVNSNETQTNCIIDSNSIQIYLNPLTNNRERHLIIKANTEIHVSDIRNQMLEISNTKIKLLDKSRWYVQINQWITLQRLWVYRGIIAAVIAFLIVLLFKRRGINNSAPKQTLFDSTKFRTPDMESPEVMDLVEHTKRTLNQNKKNEAR